MTSRLRIVLEVIKQEVWDAQNEYITWFKVVSHIGTAPDIVLYTGSEKLEPGQWVRFTDKGVDIQDKPR